MALFDRPSPVFLKTESSATEQLRQMNELLPRVDRSDRVRLERDIKLVEAGINHWHDDMNKTVVVLANQKTVLNDRYAPKEIMQQIIRADGFIDYIKKLDADNKSNGKRSAKVMEEQANLWLGRHVEQPVDVSGKYKLAAEAEASRAETAKDDGGLVCPKCGAPMVKRVAKRGERAGKEFWGCSTYPKCRSIINIAG